MSDPSKSKDAQASHSSDETVNIPRREYEELQAQARELAETRDRLLRTAADFENAKKRLARERDDFVKFSLESFAREILPVLDNMERAAAHADEKGEEKGQASSRGLLTGVQMVIKQFQEILKNQGVKKIPAVGQLFDPHCHEAVGHVAGAGRADEIVDEIEPGYFIHDRLLRAAKVRVRIPIDPGPSSDEEKQDEIT